MDKIYIIRKFEYGFVNINWNFLYYVGEKIIVLVNIILNECVLVERQRERERSKLVGWLGNNKSTPFMCLVCYGI